MRRREWRNRRGVIERARSRPLLGGNDTKGNQD